MDAKKKIEKPYLLIGTPAYGCMMHIDCHNSIMGLTRIGIQYDHMCIGNNSLVPVPRNSIISFCYMNAKYSHMLWLDADIGIAPESVAKMISWNKDVIGASVCLKGFDENGQEVVNHGSLVSSDTKGLHQTDRIGTAVLLFSKKAVNALIKVSQPYDTNPKFSRGAKMPYVHYDVFKNGAKNGEYVPEDFWACDTLRELGFTIYVDSFIETVHNGNYQFVHKTPINNITREEIQDPGIFRLI